MIDEEHEPMLRLVEHHPHVRLVTAHDSDARVVLDDNHVAILSNDAIAGRQWRCRAVLSTPTVGAIDIISAGTTNSAIAPLLFICSSLR